MSLQGSIHGVSEMMCFYYGYLGSIPGGVFLLWQSKDAYKKAATVSYWSFTTWRIAGYKYPALSVWLWSLALANGIIPPWVE